MLDKVPVEALNKLSASQNQLVLLRVLMTSDLAFTYMLYDPKTVHDIGRVAIDLLVNEMSDDCDHMSNDEIGEFQGHISALIEFLVNSSSFDSLAEDLITDLNTLDAALRKRMN
ncbi:hypothetical protein EVB91_228 [Rhizobium phage RHph_I1_18]|nr:hypothetical protein EVB91_228 [Rhizobium phage RHph_I1_18]